LTNTDRGAVGPSSTVRSLRDVGAGALSRQFGDKVRRPPFLSLFPPLCPLDDALTFSFPPPQIQTARSEELVKLLRRSDEQRRRRHGDIDGGGESRNARGGVSFAADSVLSADIDTSYRPLHKETQAVYEVLLAALQAELGDVAHDVLRSAADEVIAVIRADEGTPAAKQKEVEAVLTRGRPLKPETFGRLFNLCQKLTDYRAAVDTEGDDALAGTRGDGDGDDDGSARFISMDAEDTAAAAAEGGIDELDALYDFGDDVAADDDEEEAGADGFAGAGNDDDDDNEEGDGGRRGGARGGLGVYGQVLSGAHRDLVAPRSIDAHWVQRALARHYDDAAETQQLAERVLAALGDDGSDLRAAEARLVALLDYDKFELVKVLLRNRWAVVYCTRLAAATNDAERAAIEAVMRGDEALAQVLAQVRTGAGFGGDDADDAAARGAGAGANSSNSNEDASGAGSVFWRKPKGMLDLDALAFQAGAHVLSSAECKLPDNSEIINHKAYQEVHVPPARARPLGEDERLVPIADLPEWAHLAFPKMERLNRVQSRIYDSAMFSPGNMLVCAPTGAGKTNCAMLTIMREIGLRRVAEDDPAATNTARAEGAPALDLDSFKVVYIAPMKSLVQEMVLNFSNRLAPYGITVRELSGDSQLTKAQLQATQVIVTTPEKWDIVTRKAGDRSVTQNVRLVIIDEVHLLHDSRGPVLEAIVARTQRQVEATHSHVRLVGLSATLPNYEDVAMFLRVDTEKNLYFFDGSYRPCPLHQQFLGVNVKKALRRNEMMNQLAYEKVMEQAGKNQSLVFVHSRKDTVATARFLRDLAVEQQEIGRFLQDGSGHSEVLKSVAETATHPGLKELLPYGFAFHHAGMTREDRTLVEDLFAGQHVQVLVSTATLAWGVNLPAHSVIIKGTQVYSPEKGRWVELSPQDVTQMVGRAGRPQYDSYGEGILITTQKELQFYLSLLNEQLPVESQLLTRLADFLNAEVAAATVETVRDGVAWLHDTFLYIRMLRRPGLYGVTAEMLEEDPELTQYCTDLIHSAALVLDKGGLVRYDRKTGAMAPTELGKVASAYYLSHASMAVYNEHLRPSLNDIELFSVFSMSSEFKHMAVREEEKLELARLLDKVPIPVREGVDDHLAKVNVLLQAFLSRLSLDGFALMSDLVYVTQSAGRILRALFEVLLRRGWSQAALKALNLCKAVQHRMWSAQTPLRQFPELSAELIRRIENKDLTWEQLRELDEAVLGETVRRPQLGKRLFQYVHTVPRVHLQAHVQPVTRSTLKVTLQVTPDFRWDAAVHGAAEGFWVIVDVDDELALHSEYFTLKQRFATKEHSLSFVVPILDPLPPQYFVRVVSDRWIGADAVLPISFRHLLLPDKYPPLTQLLDLQPLPVTEVANEAFLKFFPFAAFNPVQTQVFGAVYKRDESVLVCAPTGSGKTVLAELAIMRMISRAAAAEAQREEGKDGEEDNEDAHDVHRAVYIAPYDSLAKERFLDWHAKFGKTAGVPVRMLTGDLATDLRLLEEARIVIATPPQWDALSRRWRTRAAVQQVRLVVADELHLLGARCGPTLELVLTRMRYIATQLERPVRIVGLAASVANAKDIGDWIGARNVFAFLPSARPAPLDVKITGFDYESFEGRQVAMTKPCFQAVLRDAPDSPALVFAPTRKHCATLAAELAALGAAYAGEVRAARIFARIRQGMSPDEAEKLEDPARPVWLRADAEDLAPHLKFVSPQLAELLSLGVGLFHAGMSDREREVVRRLFSLGALQITVVEASLCWSVGNSMNVKLVVLMDTQQYDPAEQRYVDLPVTDLLQMIGRANPEAAEAGKCHVFCHTPRQAFLRKFIFEPFPVESHLDAALHNCFNSEVMAKRIESIQDAIDYLTWTFYYRRLRKNPNYYNLQGTSHEFVSDHLSELVEATLDDLAQAQCLALDEDGEVSPLNLGRIADHYALDYTTVELFSKTLSSSVKLRDLLESVCEATEFADVPVRHREDVALARLAAHLPLAITNADYATAASKVNVLLQAHFSRIALTAAVSADQTAVLPTAMRLLYAAVDVASSARWLAPVISAIELTQMVTMGVWAGESQLMQVPHFTAEVSARCAKAGVRTVADLLEMEDEDRDAALQFTPAKMSDVARFCNAYPDVSTKYALLTPADEIVAGGKVSLGVVLTRDPEGDDDDFEEGVTTVVAPRYPKVKQEAWWLALGSVERNELWGIKKVSLKSKTTKIKFDFIAPHAGAHDLKLFLLSDSWVGADQEHAVSLNVAPKTDMED
jgi:pre-mRNA-splicing helicase BRR2